MSAKVRLAGGNPEVDVTSRRAEFGSKADLGPRCSSRGGPAGACDLSTVRGALHIVFSTVLILCPNGVAGMIAAAYALPPEIIKVATEVDERARCAASRDQPCLKLAMRRTKLVCQVNVRVKRR